jgi:membrane protein YqaA with SNARE-associated domain
VLDLKIAYTDEQSEKSASDAEDSAGTLSLLLKTVPLIGFAGGAICIIAGILLLLSGRRKNKSEPAHVQKSKAPAAT